MFVVKSVIKSVIFPQLEMLGFESRSRYDDE